MNSTITSIRKVTRTAKNLFPHTQTPVRVVRTDVPGVPAVVTLRPRKIPQVVSDLAEEIAIAAEERHLKKLGVLEFTYDNGSGESLRGETGPLGRWFAEALENRLRDLGEDKFIVVDRRVLQKTLSDQKFGIDDLGSTAKLKDLSEATGKMPGLVTGVFRNRLGKVLTVQCKLTQLDKEDVETAGSASGKAMLDENDWAMLGRSRERRSTAPYQTE